MSDRMFSELDQVFQDILDGVSSAGGAPAARAKLVWHCAASQQRRIASQKTRTAGAMPARRRKVYRTQQGSSSSGITRSGR